MKIYKCLTMAVGNLRLGGKKFPVMKSSFGSGKNGIIKAMTPGEVSIVESSEQFKKGNLQEISQDELRKGNAGLLYEEKLKLVDLLFTIDELQSFKDLSSETVASIRESAFELRDAELNDKENSPGDQNLDAGSGKDENGLDAGDQNNGDSTAKDSEQGDETDGGIDSGKESKSKIPAYEDITVAEIKELLEAAGAEYDSKANKPELYETLKNL